ncbi:hypothetical protein COCCADRAFT_21431 [Bipolaris zeicola 26-R-13]|uniref:Uncharacterized protein n=1 Tax=Cochliobolus carbonum (strain 26-R-13) TaxID=930089 RepID=W6YNY7_COCC2|nr:uncharacterized protein COCCADRAFT_21431 [Bipolaris zeicola 26-R-13]EUC39360.1 hypothetical protein COCCADRAFT_21431 [Bipolaris zeicola 26-R-13]
MGVSKDTSRACTSRVLGEWLGRKKRATGSGVYSIGCSGGLNEHESAVKPPRLVCCSARRPWRTQQSVEVPTVARVDRAEVLGLQSNDPRAKSKGERRQGANVGRRLAKGRRGRGAGPRGAVHGTIGRVPGSRWGRLFRLGHGAAPAALAPQRPASGSAGSEEDSNGREKSTLEADEGGAWQSAAPCPKRCRGRVRVRLTATAGALAAKAGSCSPGPAVPAHADC